MSSQVQFRFLPWARRGLAAEITDADTGGVLKSHARTSVVVTLTNVEDLRGVEASLYGPGDVIGIDPRLIVRCSPKSGATNVETNYFAAIEFDPPDFPWMFTPARAGDDQHLRPWLVLVVLDREIVGRPQVTREQPLPTVTIADDLVARELPDLNESWAWAHVQLITEQESTGKTEDQLKGEPDLNVSRLVCPRRLKPNREYVACLVPAFDAGVVRGLGGEPDPEQALGPAWIGANSAGLKLPVYFSWEFATGPAGDFESLARKLKPWQGAETVGVTSMFIGDAGPELPQLAPDQPGATALMDGALQAPHRLPGTLSEIDGLIQSGLTESVNAATEHVAQTPDSDTTVLAPPLYGQWHIGQHTIEDAMPAWTRELNLDPRSRVAAGLGAEVVRTYQEDFVQQCWEQVGDILKANEQLSFGRLALEAGRHIYRRHYATLSCDRLLQICAPLQRRTLHAGSTIRTHVRNSSLPDAVFDQAFRRLTSPQRPLLRRIRRRLLTEHPLAQPFMKSALVNSLAAGSADVDPTGFVPDGLVDTVVLARMAAGEVPDTAGLGIGPSMLEAIYARAGSVRKYTGQEGAVPALKRGAVHQSGLLTDQHVDRIHALERMQATAKGLLPSIHETLDLLLHTARANPQAQALLMALTPQGVPSFQPISVEADGSVVTRSRPDQPWKTIARIDPGLMKGSLTTSEILNSIPSGTLMRTGGPKPKIVAARTAGSLVQRPNVPLQRRGAGKGLQPLQQTSLMATAGRVLRTEHAMVEGTAPAAATRPPVMTAVLPMPYTDPTVLQSYEAAALEALGTQETQEVPVTGHLQPFDLVGAASTVLERVNPMTIVPRRIRQLVQLNGAALGEAIGADSGAVIAPGLDRIIAAPDLPAPAYRFLARYDQARFCPGIGTIPSNAITLLEPNPRFIEAFLVGLNFEMNRELLWREFPTDQRGTPFRHFWNWADRSPDIDPIHLWKRDTKLGTNIRGPGPGKQTVLLIRGELIRRYPNTVLQAWRADATGRLADPPQDEDIKAPIFQGKLDPDMIFAGFDLADTELTTGNGWLFLIQEQPTEPRFGLDLPRNGAAQPLITWGDLSWGHVGVDEGGYLALQSAATRLPQTINGLTFGANAAHMASITLQQPMRIAIHARCLTSS